MGRSIKKQYYHAIGRLKCIYYDLGAHLLLWNHIIIGILPDLLSSGFCEFIDEDYLSWYHRAAIQEWFRHGRNTSPSTALRLTSIGLTPENEEARAWHTNRVHLASQWQQCECGAVICPSCELLTCSQEGCDTEVCTLCYDDFDVCEDCGGHFCGDCLNSYGLCMGLKKKATIWTKARSEASRSYHFCY